MSKPNQYKAQAFIDAIPGTGGIIGTIAARVGCSWHTAKKYITTYATIAQAYSDECEKVVDLAESKIIGAMRDDDVSTAKWYLKMKGRDRGYAQTTRQEHTGEAGGAMKMVILPSKTGDKGSDEQ